MRSRVDGSLAITPSHSSGASLAKAQIVPRGTILLLEHFDPHTWLGGRSSVQPRGGQRIGSLNVPRGTFVPAWRRFLCTTADESPGHRLEAWESSPAIQVISNCSTWNNLACWSAIGCNEARLWMEVEALRPLAPKMFHVEQSVPNSGIVPRGTILHCGDLFH